MLAKNESSNAIGNFPQWFSHCNTCSIIARFPVQINFTAYTQWKQTHEFRSKSTSCQR